MRFGHRLLGSDAACFHTWQQGFAQLPFSGASPLNHCLIERVVQLLKEARNNDANSVNSLVRHRIAARWQGD